MVCEGDVGIVSGKMTDMGNVTHITKPNIWRNRVVAHIEIDPAQLLANPKNWRVHPRHQQDALKGMIDDLGYTDEIEIQQHTDMVLDGHLRVALALRDHQPVIPAAVLDLNDNEADKYLLTKDPISAMANADAANLRVLMDETSISNAAVVAMLADVAANAGVTLPEFREYDESVADEVEYLECPECSHRWPK